MGDVDGGLVKACQSCGHIVVGVYVKTMKGVLTPFMAYPDLAFSEWAITSFIRIGLSFVVEETYGSSEPMCLLFLS
eukprot:scaffold118905_cov19-Tisochrysis_lutea.AAC.1